ncbi:MAG: PAS domain S-box protein [Chloroflexi bacterium]|nr:PAS domain S-box protein [Chloroflexota bacterium]
MAIATLTVVVLSAGDWSEYRLLGVRPGIVLAVVGVAGLVLAALSYRRTVTGLHGCLAEQADERARAEAALSNSARILNAFVESSPHAILATDLSDRLTVWNRVAERMFGWTSNEVLGRALDWVPEDRPEDDCEDVAAGRDGQQPPVIHTWRRHRDGHLVEVALARTPLFDAHGKLAGHLEIVQDVGEQRASERAHEALLERERLARAEAEALAELSATAARNDDSSETLAVAVMALPRLIGAHICGVALPGTDGILRFAAAVGDGGLLRRTHFRSGEGYVGRAVAGGQITTCDDTGVEDGAKFPWIIQRLEISSLICVPLVARGRACGVIVAGARTVRAFGPREIGILSAFGQQLATAVDAAEARAESLREAGQKAAILEQMGEAVLAVDRDGRITLANAAAGALFEQPPDEIVGLGHQVTPWRLMDERGAPLTTATCPIARALNADRVTSPFRLILPDGTERAIFAASVPMRDARGHIVGAIVLARDVSDERRRQRQAIEGEKLRALGQLAGGVAHDLNQILALVSGYGELALEQLGQSPRGDVAAREAVGVMVRAALDGGHTVKRLLAFARAPESGPIDVVDIASLLDEAAHLTAPRWRDATQAEGRPIRMEISVDGAACIEGVPAELREALTNLIFNAVDALPAGGAIRLTAVAIGDTVRLAVADDGVGMTPETRERIFEPFFSTKGERGTGLGLSMVYGIVERHGGRIGVESAPGQGTTFLLTFPLTQRAPIRPTSPQPETQPLAAPQLRILVVDDEEAIARMIQTALERDGHAVALAVTGEDALDRLASSSFDLVVTDLGLGEGINGWDVVDQGRMLAPGIAWILATGWGAEIDPDEARARGIAAVMAKPYRLADLRDQIRRIGPQPAARLQAI